VAAALWFRIRVFCSRGSLTPVAAPNDSPNDFWRVTGRPDAKKRIRICVLKDVAWGPRVETGANVPSYSGGVAAAWWFRIRVFCGRGSLTPVAAPNVSPNDFWRVTGRPDAKKRIRICVLKDVAWGPRVKAGTSVPSYSGGVAAAWWFRIRVFCGRGSLTPVAAPNVSPNDFLAGDRATGCEEADSDLCFEGCGLGATCESRDQRAQLQRRRGRRVVVSDSGLLWPWVADSGRGAERFSERFLAGDRATGCEEADSDLCFEGCGLGATCGNRDKRAQLQRRRGRLRSFLFCVERSECVGSTYSLRILTALAEPCVFDGLFRGGR
jgi:hypothetical protein